VIRAGSGAGTAAAGGRAASVRAGRGDIPGWGAAARAVTSLAQGSARGRPGGRAVPGHVSRHCRDRAPDRGAPFRLPDDARLVERLVERRAG
jgi:hypothetical protein